MTTETTTPDPRQRVAYVLMPCDNGEWVGEVRRGQVTTRRVVAPSLQVLVDNIIEADAVHRLRE